jgi:putative peptidoglycan lipid II flippase
MSLNIGFSYLFSSLFFQWGWMPHGGLALANSLATTLEAFALWWVIRHRLKGLPAVRILSGVFQAALASLPMGIFLWYWLQLSEKWSAWQSALLGIILGAGIFLLAAMLMKTPELQIFYQALSRRIGSKS